MKKLVCLVLVLAVSSVVSASVGTIIEDFESYPLGALDAADGWTATGAEVIMGANGTKSIKDLDAIEGFDVFFFA